MKLEEFNSAITKLRRVAKGLGVKVIAKDKHNAHRSAYYNCKTKEIFLSPTLKNKEFFVYSFCHELGHAIDLSEMPKKVLSVSEDAVEKFNVSIRYGLNIPPSYGRLILEQEKRAWRLGDLLLKKLKIKLNRDMKSKLRKKGLDSYRQNIKPKS